MMIEQAFVYYLVKQTFSLNPYSNGMMIELKRRGWIQMAIVGLNPYSNGMMIEPM